ncbi:MAG: hypothetical protein WKF73_15210 [Nocardioidaceae bacterium]
MLKKYALPLDRTAVRPRLRLHQRELLMSDLGLDALLMTLAWSLASVPPG